MMLLWTLLWWPIALLLIMLSWIYYAIICFKTWWFQLFSLSEPFDAGVLTVSIGNISMGGTGKTPLLLEFLRWTQAHNINAIVATRAYRSKSEHRGFLLTPEQQSTSVDSLVEQLGDEAALVHSLFPKLPMALGKHRSAQLTGLKALVGDQTQLVLLDDGFQHSMVRRDVDCVLVDASMPLQHRYLFPRGRLREPFHALFRAQYVFLTKVNLVSPKEVKDWIYFLSTHMAFGSKLLFLNYQLRHFKGGITGKQVELSEIEGRRVVLFSGLAQNHSFAATLKGLPYSVDLKQVFSFTDHHHYTKEQLLQMEQVADSEQDILICTEKDFVKVAPLASPSFLAKLWVACMTLELERDYDREVPEKFQMDWTPLYGEKAAVGADDHSWDLLFSRLFQQKY